MGRDDSRKGVCCLVVGWWVCWGCEEDDMSKYGMSLLVVVLMAGCAGGEKKVESDAIPLDQCCEYYEGCKRGMGICSMNASYDENECKMGCNPVVGEEQTDEEHDACIAPCEQEYEDVLVVCDAEYEECVQDVDLDCAEVDCPEAD
jgi:hypothetical protein